MRPAAFFLDGGLDVSLSKVAAFEEHGQACRLGQSIGEAITVIQRGRVPPFSIPTECVTRGQRLLFVNRYDLYSGARKEEIKITQTVVATATLYDNGSFHESRSGNQARLGPLNGLIKRPTFRLIIQYGD